MPEDNASWILISIGLVLCVLEIFVPGFVIFPIGVGGIMAGVVTYFGVPLNLALVIWSLTSLMFWLSLRTIFKKVTPVEYKTGIEALVGKEAKVIEEIKGEKGRVKIFGDEWEVINESGKDIPVETKVKIIGFEGNKLKISLER